MTFGKTMTVNRCSESFVLFFYRLFLAFFTIFLLASFMKIFRRLCRSRRDLNQLSARLQQALFNSNTERNRKRMLLKDQKVCE